MVFNTTTDIRIEALEKSIVLPKEVIDFADKEDIFIPHYLELLSNALYSKEIVDLNHKRRLMSNTKFLHYLVDTISSYAHKGLSPEEISYEMDEFTYADFLTLFEKFGHNVRWYKSH